ncbi:MAG TPA: hypothetical protein VJ861_12110 [Treponemataceae bacterium]|nr:hypothetical protein [Treponemataceae bacterium]
MKTKIKKVLLPKLLVLFFIFAAQFSSFVFSQEKFPISIFGDAFTEIGIGVSDPFNEDGEVSRNLVNNGRTAVSLQGTAGDRYTAKVDFSLLGSLAYNGSAVPAVLPPTLDVKKLYVSVFTEPADFFAGRMIVNYGRGTVLSPADIFSGIDTGNSVLGKTGVDAARVLIPLGAISGMEIVSTIAEKPQNARAGIRGYGNIKGWDFGLSSFYTGEEKSEMPHRAVFAFDTKGDAIVGLCAEAVASVDLENFTEVRGSAMLGFDYSFSNEVFFDFEYQWNGTSGNLGVFKGDHTVFASTSWQPNELFSANASVVKALPEKEALLNFSATYSLVQNALLSGFVRYSRGTVQNPGELSGANAAVGASIHVLF